MAVLTTRRTASMMPSDLRAPARPGVGIQMTEGHDVPGQAPTPDGLAENVTSPAKRHAMTAVERKRLQRERTKAADQQRGRLYYTAAEWREFVSVSGLPRKAGADWPDMARLVLKELADNAADEGGAWIEANHLGSEHWLIADNGPGIDPAEVPRLFSLTRPMTSSKKVRQPRRGMLGNGLRVVCGYCAIYKLPIVVESRGVATVLRFDRDTGRTEIERQQRIELAPG